jgi:hypothetical protein
MIMLLLFVLSLTFNIDDIGTADIVTLPNVLIYCYSTKSNHWLKDITFLLEERYDDNIKTQADAKTLTRDKASHIWNKLLSEKKRLNNEERGSILLSLNLHNR